MPVAKREYAPAGEDRPAGRDGGHRLGVEAREAQGIAGERIDGRSAGAAPVGADVIGAQRVNDQHHHVRAVGPASQAARVDRGGDRARPGDLEEAAASEVHGAILRPARRRVYAGAPFSRARTGGDGPSRAPRGRPRGRPARCLARARARAPARARARAPAPGSGSTATGSGSGSGSGSGLSGATGAACRLAARPKSRAKNRGLVAGSGSASSSGSGCASARARAAPPARAQAQGRFRLRLRLRLVHRGRRRLLHLRGQGDLRSPARWLDRHGSACALALPGDRVLRIQLRDLDLAEGLEVLRQPVGLAQLAPELGR